MKALIKREAGITDLELVDLPIPECGDDEVVLKVRACAICGSDLHIYKWHFQPPLPVVMGHEFCGEIAVVGKNVKDWKVGEFVVSNLGGTCGKCQCCADGNSYICLNKRSPGLFSPGAYAEYVKTQPEMLYRVPEGISDELAACFEPACTVLHAMKRIAVKQGDVVVVAGVGLIGLLTIMMAKNLYGAKKVIAIGVTSDEKARFAVAKQLGADVVVNTQTTDAVAEVLKELPDGFKADVVIDCSGAPASINSLLKMVKRNGTFGAVGVTPTDVDIPINWYNIVFGSLRIIASYSHEAADWEDVVELMKQGKLDFSACITNVISLEDWATVFKNPGDPNFIKGVFKF